MAVFTETIQLEDKVSGPAKAASDSVGGLAKTVNSTLAAIAQLAKSGLAARDSLGRFTGSARAAGGASSALAKPLTDVGKRAFDASTAMQVGKEVIGGAIAGIKNAFSALAQGDVRGAITGLTDGIASAAKALDLLVPGLGKAVSALVTFAGGLLGGIAALAKFAIETSTAKAQMLSMFDALGEGSITGEKVDDMLDGMSQRLGITKDAMVPLTKSFLQMGITSEDALQRMTTAALSAKALVGGADSGAAAFEKLAKKIQLASQTGQGLKIPIKGLGSLADMGLTVDDVAKKMGVSSAKLAAELKAGSADAKKFGEALQSALIEKGKGPLEAMSLSLDNLGGMLKQYMGDVFEDMMPVIKPFLEELKGLFGIFDSKTKPCGQAIKSALVGGLTQVFAVATKLVPLIRHFLLDLIIYALKAYIAVKPVVAKFKEFAASAAGAAILSKVVSALGTALKVVGVVVLVVVAALVVLWAAMVGIGLVIWTVVGAIVDFVAATSTTLAGWVASAIDAAGNFISGLVNGIKSGAAAVIAAVTGVVGGAIDAAKKKLGIASPSKVAASLSSNFGDTFAGGLDDAANDVHAASKGMAGAAVAGASSGLAAPGTASSSGTGSGTASSSGTVVYINVQIDGAGKSAQEISDEMVAQSWERARLAAGVG